MGQKLKKILIGEFSFKRLVRSFFIISILIYILIMAFLSLFADKIIFQPPEAFYQDDASIIKIPTENGENISARYFENPAADYTILFSHGNAEDIGSAAPFLEELKQAGFSVFAYDYRGYGTSLGKPSEKNSYRDILAAFGYLQKELKIPPEKIIIHGRSLGGAVSIDLAAKQNCGGLIVESSFVSAFRVVTKYKIFPFDKFESINKIGKVKCPVLFIHGKRDGLIPIWHSERLFEEAKQPKNNFWVEHADHNNVFLVTGNSYLSTIIDFSKTL